MSLLDSKESWDSNTVPQRVTICQSVGLEGKVAGREWESLEADERLALNGTNMLMALLGVNVAPSNYRNEAEIMRCPNCHMDLPSSKKCRECGIDWANSVYDPRIAEAQKLMEEKRVGMRSIANDIVNKILEKGG